MPVSVKKGSGLRPVVDCGLQDWEDSVLQNVSAIQECDLINFDFDSQGDFCQRVTRGSPLEFRPDRDSTLRQASLRQRWK